MVNSSIQSLPLGPRSEARPRSFPCRWRSMYVKFGLREKLGVMGTVISKSDIASSISNILKSSLTWYSQLWDRVACHSRNVPRARIARKNLVPQHILSSHSQIEASWLPFLSWFDMNSLFPPVESTPSTWGIKRFQRNFTTWVIPVT